MIRIYYLLNCPYCKALIDTLKSTGVDPFTDARLDLRPRQHPDYASDSAKYNYSQVPLVINLSTSTLLGGYNDVSPEIRRMGFNAWYNSQTRVLT